MYSMSVNFSLSRIDSISLSLGDMSGLIEIPGKELSLNLLVSMKLSQHI